MELFEALSNSFPYQVVGQDNGVDTMWTFDNGTQKLGVKLAAIKPGALKKYKPSERVAQFFIFRVTDSGKTGGSPKTIAKPFQSIATLGKIVASATEENKLNSFVFRFPAEVDGQGLTQLLQSVSNRVSKIKFDAAGFYSFDGMKFGYSIFVRKGRDMLSFYGKEWEKYAKHQDVIEYINTMKLTNFDPKKSPAKEEKKIEIAAGIARSLDAQRTRAGYPAVIKITDIAGGDEIPAQVADFNKINKSVYTDPTVEPEADFNTHRGNFEIDLDKSSISQLFAEYVDGLKTKEFIDPEDGMHKFDLEQKAWVDKFRNKKLTIKDITTGEALDFIKEWANEGFVSGYFSAYDRGDGTANMERLVDHIVRGYALAISRKVILQYESGAYDGYIHSSSKSAVALYTSNYYRVINGALSRGDGLIDPEVHTNIKNLDDAFKRSGVMIPPSVILYRGTPLRPHQFKKAVLGKALYFRPFVSCSLRPDIGMYEFGSQYGVVLDGKLKGRELEITADSNIDERVHTCMIISGAHRVPVLVPGRVSGYADESEVILSRGTTMIVNGYSLVSDDKYATADKVSGFTAASMDLEIVSSKEVNIQESYDGDHFMKTGELKKMDFSTFLKESKKKVPKQTPSQKRMEFMNRAQLGYKKKQLTNAEKKTAQRIQDKFQGDLGINLDSE
ncbi:MAG: hypothetical protein [Caudoviricetes sp.]|nr:MAG: hypothetical protein [Caudoviricetes sp.]